MRKLTDQEMEQTSGGFTGGSFGFGGDGFIVAEDFTHLRERLVAMAPPEGNRFEGTAGFIGAELLGEPTPAWQAEIERLPSAAPPQITHYPSGPQNNRQHRQQSEPTYRGRTAQDYAMRENYTPRQLSFRTRFTQP